MPKPKKELPSTKTFLHATTVLLEKAGLTREQAEDMFNFTNKLAADALKGKEAGSFILHGADKNEKDLLILSWVKPGGNQRPNQVCHSTFRYNHDLETYVLESKSPRSEPIKLVDVLGNVSMKPIIAKAHDAGKSSTSAIYSALPPSPDTSPRIGPDIKRQRTAEPQPMIDPKPLIGPTRPTGRDSSATGPATGSTSSADSSDTTHLYVPTARKNK